MRLPTAYERELRMGGAFIFTDKPLRIQDKVVLALCIDYAGATVEQEATVVHITLPQGTTRAGVSVMFNDKKALEASLKPYMELKAGPGEAAAPQAEARRRRGTGRRSATGAPRARLGGGARAAAHAAPLSPSASSTSLLLSLMIAAGPRPPTARCAASWAHCSKGPSAKDTYQKRPSGSSSFTRRLDQSLSHVSKVALAV